MPSNNKLSFYRTIGIALIFLVFANVQAQDEKLQPEMDFSTGLHSNAIRIIKVIHNGNVYVGSDNGLNILGSLSYAQQSIIDQVGNKGIWGLETYGELLFVGTRFDGLKIYNTNSGKLVYDYANNQLNLIRKIKAFDKGVFILTNTFAYIWEEGKLKKIKSNRPSESNFFIDVFKFEKDIYGIIYPKGSIFKYENYSFIKNVNMEFLGKNEDPFFQPFCSFVDGDKVYLPNSAGDLHSILIFEKDKPLKDVKIFKGLPAGYVIWDIVVIGKKIVLGIGDTYSNDKGFIYASDSDNSFTQIEPTEYVNCLALDSINNILFYGTQSNGLFCQPAISYSSSVNKPNNHKLTVNQDFISLSGLGESFSYQKGNFLSIKKEKNSYLTNCYLGDTLFVSSKNDIKGYNANTLRPIKNLILNHPYTPNALASSEVLSYFDSANVKKSFIYRFNTYGQVHRYDLQTSKDSILKDVESFLPLTFKKGERILFLNKEKGFNIIEPLSAYPLFSKDENVPFARDFTLIGDTIFLLIRNQLEILKIDYRKRELIPIDSYETTNLCEGFTPEWIMSRNGKLYLINYNGILQINPFNGTPINYYWVGKNYKIQKPIISVDKLIWNTDKHLFIVPFSEIDKPPIYNDANIFGLNHPENLNENIEFKAEAKVQQYVLLSHSLKKLEVWKNNTLLRTKFSIDNIFSFKDGLKYGDYKLILENGNKQFKTTIAISLPLNRNPYFFGLILLFVSLLLILLLIYYLDRRTAQKKLLHLNLQNLKQNLNPHFVYNSMNLISALILESRNEEAVKVVAEFSKLQRTYLETNNKDQISLQEELDFLGIYLKLQQRRFDINNRFEYKIEIETTEDISSISVPPLILQPIAENAIKHGIIGSTSSEKWIHVDISSDEKNIIINIEDNGDFKKTNFDLGMGQKLVHQRIEIYNKINRKKLSVVSGLHPRFSNAGYRVELKIPIGGKL